MQESELKEVLRWTGCFINKFVVSAGTLDGKGEGRGQVQELFAGSGTKQYTIRKRPGHWPRKNTNASSYVFFCAYVVLLSVFAPLAVKYKKSDYEKVFT